ncbi:hypothetical protein SO802_017348 [Lithocarpus litseifolius]|uniref:Amino acid transporter transmembrane domain-containing protein n=1 Tax=Lithocarpus litseifolius TaxID=425828 RepID=A0AAW2CZQ5_9ROSI
MFFGAFELVLSQLPDIHSLRWVRRLSYSLQGSSSRKTFRAFNALRIIAFSFGDAMLPKIQVTCHKREPARKNMYKGVSAAYSVIILSYWQLASWGYWAFGSEVQPYILSSLSVPEWTIIMANLFAVIQISGCYQIYCRPTYAYFEEKKCCPAKLLAISP